VPGAAPARPPLPTSPSQPVASTGVPNAEQPAAPAPPAPSPLDALRASVSEEIGAEVPEKKVPFYKREISFGGKKKKKAPSAKVVVAASAVVPSAEIPVKKVPFYKREISFGGKKKAPPAKVVAAAPAVPAAEAPPSIPGSPVAAPAGTPEKKVPSEKKVPFYKREISLGGKKKKASAKFVEAVPAVPAAEAPPSISVPPVAAPAGIPVKKVPFYKREISFGGKKKAPPVKAVAAAPVAEGASAAVVAPAAPVVTPAKVPFYKRELSLGHKAASASAPKGSALRQKALVGVKIGASGISAARVVRNGSKLELLDLVHEPLQRGVVVAGEVRDPSILAATLAHLFNSHNLPKKAVRLGISNNRIGVRIIEVSGVMDARQLENAIRFRAQEVLPIALEDAVLDFQQLDESVNADGELVRRILLVVAYRDLIDRYVVAFKEAGVRLVGIDLEAFGLLRALIPESLGERSDAAHVVVSIGHERSTFAVSDGHICEFTRVLDWGGSTLDVAIARQLNLAPSEAEPVKHSLALDGSERPPLPGVTEEQISAAADIVRRQLQTFARELVSSLQYYQNQPDSLGIGDIVITGGTSLLPGLAMELQRLIGVSVRVGDPFERVKPSKGVVVDESQCSLAAAIGLAIED
jgi:type IV pilus assembly protein PilM